MFHLAERLTCANALKRKRDDPAIDISSKRKHVTASVSSNTFKQPYRVQSDTVVVHSQIQLGADVDSWSPIFEETERLLQILHTGSINSLIIRHENVSLTVSFDDSKKLNIGCEQLSDTADIVVFNPSFQQSEFSIKKCPGFLEACEPIVSASDSTCRLQQDGDIISIIENENFSQRPMSFEIIRNIGKGQCMYISLLENVHEFLKTKRPSLRKRPDVVRLSIFLISLTLRRETIQCLKQFYRKLTIDGDNAGPRAERLTSLLAEYDVPNDWPTMDAAIQNQKLYSAYATETELELASGMHRFYDQCGVNWIVLKRSL
jgi:hypothetical protein